MPNNETLGLYPLKPGQTVRENTSRDDYVIHSIAAAAAGGLLITGLSVFDRSTKEWVANTYSDLDLTILRGNVEGLNPEEVLERLQKLYGKAEKEGLGMGFSDFRKILYSPKGKIWRDLLLLGDAAGEYSKEMVQIAEALVRQTKYKFTGRQIYAAFKIAVDPEEVSDEFLATFANEAAKYIEQVELKGNLGFKMKIAPDSETQELSKLLFPQGFTTAPEASQQTSSYQLMRRYGLEAGKAKSREASKFTFEGLSQRLRRNAISAFTDPGPQGHLFSGFDQEVLKVLGVPDATERLTKMVTIAFASTGAQPNHYQDRLINPAVKNSLSRMLNSEGKVTGHGGMRVMDALYESPFGKKILDRLKYMSNTGTYLYQVRRNSASRTLESSSVRTGINKTALARIVAEGKPDTGISLERTYFTNTLLKNKTVKFTYQGHSVIGKTSDPAILNALIRRLQGYEKERAVRSIQAKPSQVLSLLNSPRNRDYAVDLDEILRTHEEVTSHLSPTSLSSLESLHGEYVGGTLSRFNPNGRGAIVYSTSPGLSQAEEFQKLSKKFELETNPGESRLFFSDEDGRRVFTKNLAFLRKSLNEGRKVGTFTLDETRIKDLPQGLFDETPELSNILGTLPHQKISFTSLSETEAEVSMTSSDLLQERFMRGYRSQKLALASMGNGDLQFIGTELGHGVTDQVRKLREVMKEAGSLDIAYLDFEFNEARKIQQVGLLPGDVGTRLLSEFGGRSVASENFAGRNQNIKDAAKQLAVGGTRLKYLSDTTLGGNLNPQERLEYVTGLIDELSKYRVIVSQTRAEWSVLEGELFNFHEQGLMSTEMWARYSQTLRRLETDKGLDASLAFQMLPSMSLLSTSQEAATKAVFGHMTPPEAHDALLDTLDVLDILQTSAPQINNNLDPRRLSIKNFTNGETIIVPQNTSLRGLHNQPLKVLGVVDQNDTHFGDRILTLQVERMAPNEYGVLTPTGDVTEISGFGPAGLQRKLGNVKILHDKDLVRESPSIVQGSRAYLSDLAQRELRSLNPFSTSVYSEFRPQSEKYGPFSSRFIRMARYASRMNGSGDSLLGQVIGQVNLQNIRGGFNGPQHKLEYVADAVEELVPKDWVLEEYLGIPAQEADSWIREEADLLQDVLKQHLIKMNTDTSYKWVYNDKASPFKKMLDSPVGALIDTLGNEGDDQLDTVLFQRRLMEKVYRDYSRETSYGDVKLSFGLKGARSSITIGQSRVLGAEPGNAMEAAVAQFLYHADEENDFSFSLQERMKTVFGESGFEKLSKNVTKLKEAYGIKTNASEYFSSAKQLSEAIGGIGFNTQAQDLLNHFRYKLFRSEEAIEMAMSGMAERTERFIRESEKPHVRGMLMTLEKSLRGIDQNLDDQAYTAQFKAIMNSHLSGFLQDPENFQRMTAVVEEPDFLSAIEDLSSDEDALGALVKASQADKEALARHGTTDLFYQAQLAAKAAQEQARLEGLSGREQFARGSAAFDEWMNPGSMVSTQHQEALDAMAAPTKPYNVQAQHAAITRAKQGVAKTRIVEDVHEAVIRRGIPVMDKMSVPLLALGGAIALMAANSPHTEDYYSPGKVTDKIGLDNLGIAANAEIPGTKNFPLIFTGQTSPFKLDINLRGFVKSEAEKEKVVQQVFNALNSSIEFRSVKTDVKDKRNHDSKLQAMDILRRRL